MAPIHSGAIQGWYASVGSARLPRTRLERRIRRGDARAFEQLFRRFHQEIYRYCLAIVRDRDDAEDALQATMAAALRALPGEERTIELKPWLYRVAHNESISLLRARRPTVEAVEETLPADSGSELHAELEVRERLRGLVADLRSLPDRQRGALVMRELSGLSYGEIGAALDCSDAAARQTVYEARMALKRLAEGRAMECEAVRKAVSARDGRRLRGLAIRAHLRSCEDCRAFQAVIGERSAALQALCPPLAAPVAAGIWASIFGGAKGGAAGAAGASGTIAGAGAAGAGGVGGGAVGGAGGAGIVAAGSGSVSTLAGAGIAGSAALKGASIVAALGIAAGAADVGGVIDLPNPLDRGAVERGVEPQAVAPAPAASEESATPAIRPGDATAPGRSEQAPRAGNGKQAAAGASGRGHGRSGTGNRAPATGAGHGNSGSPPGQSGTAPGQSGATPGQSGATPGQSGTAPGQSGSAPGTGSSAVPPGQSGTNQGQTTAPGQGASGPAQPPEGPASGSTAQGRSGAAPGQSRAEPTGSEIAPDAS